MILHGFGVSDVGRVRPRNEDSFVVRTDIGVFAVADGMGGHAAGDVASRTALDVFVDSIKMTALDDNSVREAMNVANYAVWKHGTEDPGKTGMGTTLTVVVFADDRESCIIAHVGDTRVYLARANTLEQLTRDHTAAQDLVDTGHLDKHSARRHPLANMLRRSVGTRPDVEADIARLNIATGDLLLICSDGLTGMLEEEELQRIIQQAKPIQQIGYELVHTANSRGGIDNITAVLIRAE